MARVRGTGVLFGQVLAVLGTVTVGIWRATQWTAAQLGYQSRLGAPWFEMFDVPVYAPWRLFGWWFSYEAYAPQVFCRGGAIAAGGGFASIAVAIAMSLWRSRQAKRATTYGSACWKHGRGTSAETLSGPAMPSAGGVKHMQSARMRPAFVSPCKIAEPRMF